MIEQFEHADLGPLPIDPKLIRFRAEAEAWKKKYEDLFQEQCKVTSLDNMIRERLRCAELDRDRFRAKSEALMEILKEMISE